jgi:hypothetical protein
MLLEVATGQAWKDLGDDGVQGPMISILIVAKT